MKTARTCLFGHFGKKFSLGVLLSFSLSFCQFHKMVKHIQTIRRQIADELFEYV